MSPTTAPTLPYLAGASYGWGLGALWSLFSTLSPSTKTMHPVLPAPTVDFAPFSYQGGAYKTWYTVYGDLKSGQTPLVVLHGGPGMSHDYMLALADLSAHSIPVILYDQIGNGRSTRIHDKPATFWTIDLFIDELESLLKHLKIDSAFDLYGHSWGGILSSEFCVRRQPPGLRHLVLADSLTSMALWNKSVGERTATLPQEAQDKIAAGPGNITAFREGLDVLYGEYGCRVKPMPAEMAASLELNWGETRDRTVADAM
jgi:proline-specific peptidase